MTTRPHTPSPHARRAGFTLLEMVVVLVVLAVLAAIGVVRSGDMARRSQYASTYAGMQAIAKSADMYKAEFGVFPPNAANGVAPTELALYLRPETWATKPAIGGSWDWNSPTGPNFGTDWSKVGPNIAVHNAPKRSRDYPAMDKAFDDNNVNTGPLQNVSTSLCYLLGH